jgi:AcrR family transcriptional regulator
VTDRITERVHRPRDRKQRIVVAAAQLFRDRGYHNVSLADVAASVGITAPALYKHFRNKEELLGYAVAHGLGDLDAAVATAATLEEFVAARVAAARERHTLVALWQREARHLPADQRRELRRRVIGIGDRLALLVKGARPELDDGDAAFLAWALLAVFSSFANHRITVPRREFQQLLRRLAHEVVGFHFLQATPPVGDVDSAAGPSNEITLLRRERLLVSAIRLIDERGYQSVSMTDIGAAAGITGPSVYKHYPAKSDLLVAAMVRAHERLRIAMTQALHDASDPQDAFDRLLRAQIAFTDEHRNLTGVLISERAQLPEADRQRFDRAQRDVLETWVSVLDAAYPGLGPAQARIVLNADFAVINQLVRNRRVSERPDLSEQLVALTTRLSAAR